MGEICREFYLGILAARFALQTNAARRAVINGGT